MSQERADFMASADNILAYTEELEVRLREEEQRITALTAERDELKYRLQGWNDVYGEQLDALTKRAEEAEASLKKYEGWSPHQFLGLLEEHRKLGKAYVELDSKRYAAERDLADARAMGDRLGRMLEWTGNLEMPMPSHAGPCGPEAGCDGVCVELASIGKTWREVGMLLKEWRTSRANAAKGEKCEE